MVAWRGWTATRSLALRVSPRKPLTEPPTAYNIVRAANARFRPGGDSLVDLLADSGIRASVMQFQGSQFVEVMVAEPDLGAARAIILEHRRARLAGLQLIRRCPGCGYSLAGLSEPGTCPECGRDLEADRDELILADEFQDQPEEPAAETSAGLRRRRRSRDMLLTFAGLFGFLTVVPLAATMASGVPAYLILAAIPASLVLVLLLLVRHTR